MSLDQAAACSLSTFVLDAVPQMSEPGWMARVVTPRVTKLRRLLLHPPRNRLRRRNAWCHFMRGFGDTPGVSMLILTLALMSLDSA